MGLGALSERTAQLPRLDLQIPKRIIGRNTEECILSGTIVGMAAMLDGMVQRIEAELGSPAPSSSPAARHASSNRSFYILISMTRTFC